VTEDKPHMLPVPFKDHNPGLRLNRLHSNVFESLTARIHFPALIAQRVPDLEGT
jgi:hypothetical protein